MEVNGIVFVVLTLFGSYEQVFYINSNLSAWLDTTTGEWEQSHFEVHFLKLLKTCFHIILIIPVYL